MGLEDSDLLDDGDSGGKASSVSCSICLEIVLHNGDRSWAKLQCGHQFHLGMNLLGSTDLVDGEKETVEIKGGIKVQQALDSSKLVPPLYDSIDCIGSAFNIKGAMQCPNCRKIEKGQWLYASGSRPFPEFSMDDWVHDEDLYDLSYSEMSFGVHWCPFSGITRLPSSFEEGEFSSTSYHDFLGQHAIFAEHTAVSSATHPCPYIAYIGPIHPSSSNSGGNVSDGSSFNNQWNGLSVPSEMPSSYGFPAMDLHYHSWEHHSSPFPTSSSRVGAAEQPTVSSVTHRAPRPNSDVLRSGNFVHPFVSHSSAARAGASVSSAMVPPYPGSVARARDRVQALQAYFQQPSNSPGLRAPVMAGSRRSSTHRGLAHVGPLAAASDQSGSFYFFTPASSSRNFQEAENPISNRVHAWEREQLTPFSLTQPDRDQGWGPFYQAASGSTSFRQRHGSERMPSQNRS